VSLILDIADAVVAELAAGVEADAFSIPFTPARKVLPLYELADLAELHVTVMPKAVLAAAATRASRQYDVTIDVGVQQKLTGDLDDEIVVLLDLVEELSDFLARRPLADAAHARWVSSANDPVYAPEHLLDHRSFTSVLTLTYRAVGSGEVGGT